MELDEQQLGYIKYAVIGILATAASVYFSLGVIPTLLAGVGVATIVRVLFDSFIDRL